MHLQPGSRYTAMGSSFAAGPGLRPRAANSPRRAGRSAANYAHVLAARLHLDLTDVTFSGATAVDLLTSPRPGIPPQLAAVTPDTRVVTITAGGNDVGYLPTITLDSLPRPLRASPSIRHRIETARDPEVSAARFERLRRTLDTVIARTRQRAPDALVLLVGYLSILPAENRVSTDPGARPSQETAEWAFATAEELRRTWASASARHGIRFVDVGSGSEEHHLAARVPWVRGFHPSLRGGAPYHPTEAGMRAVADMIAAAIDGDSTLLEGPGEHESETRP